MAAAAPHRVTYRTPLPEKLGIRDGARVLIASAPDGFAPGDLPERVQMLRTARGPLDVVLVFATRRSQLARRFGTLVHALAPAGRLWVAWPKRASGAPTDLSFPVVQRMGLDAGLVDNKSAAIDQTYQGLQFVHRLVDRPRR